MNKLVGSLIIGGLMAMSPIMAMAQTTTVSVNAQVQAMLDQIKALQVQIEALKTAQAQVASTSANVSSTLSLIRNLKQGMSGDDVKTLQAILAADSTIYPEGTISGFYGKLTAEAVKKFQKKYGFEQVGSVGPKTLKKLNEVIKELGLSQESDDDDEDDNDNNTTGSENRKNSEEKKLCVPPGHTIAPGWLKKNDKPTPTSLIPLCNDKKGNNNGTTTKDTVAPSISSIISAPGTTSGTIYWTTNEYATTKVYYGTTTTGVDTNATSTLSVSNGSLVLNHGITITGLTGSTLYYYVVESKDASGNKATSTVNSFTTLAVPDTTAPSISALGTSNLLGTTTSITWTTDETANSKIWYGTSTPVVTTGSANITDTNFVTSHTLNLSGLATSTTYYYVVTSSDSAGNTATSSQSSFVTTAGL